MKKIIFTLSFIVAAYLLNAQVLYGTTYAGGNNNGGTICKLDITTNTVTPAFSFNAVDGKYPGRAGLLQASDGKLYGMTSQGGSNSVGVIFLYDPADSTYTSLMDFDWQNENGINPAGSLMQASDGKLYGMTTQGGSGAAGVIFSYNPATSSYVKLHDFDGTNGGLPQGSLIQASDGKLYGMTTSGGAYGSGVIFSFDPVNSKYSKLNDFKSASGRLPWGSLMQAFDGKLYAMTTYGGSNDYGVIFSFDPATATYVKLHDFDGTNGGLPQSSLIQASDGKLYGMTNTGGNGDYGVIFSYEYITATYTKLKDFDKTNGGNPNGDLLQASDGRLYGMTTSGGRNVSGAIFSFYPTTATYIKLHDFYDTSGSYPYGNLVQATDGNFYGMTNSGGITDCGVIFSYESTIPAYTKLRDFGNNHTGNSIRGSLIEDEAKKLYGMTYEGGHYGLGTIFSFDATTSVFTKLKDFDGRNGANPQGKLTSAVDGKLYGMTTYGGSNNIGVIFSYDPATSAYTTLFDFDHESGDSPTGSLTQASDGKLYGMTTLGGGYEAGVIFSFDPAVSNYTKLVDLEGDLFAGPSGSLVQASDGNLYGMTFGGGISSYGVIFSFDPGTSTYTNLHDFNRTNGGGPFGDLVQASDGSLYGMTHDGGSYDDGVIFSYEPTTAAYAKLVDFDGTNGANPLGSLIQASDGKLYGMSSAGGSNGYGVAFSYDPATATYSKLSDFTGDNGSYPQYTSFTEIPASSGIQISIADKSVIEGNRDRKFIAIPVILSEKQEKIIRVKYTTQNNTATAGSDYAAQSGTLVFPPGLKKIILPIRIKGDGTPEANETFSIILSDPVNATIADSTAIITISDDDASALNASKATAATTRAISLSPNPAQDNVNIILTGYSGNVILQLSSSDGGIIQQQKLSLVSAKLMQQQINVGSYANGTYLVTAIDEKGKRQTERLVVDR